MTQNYATKNDISDLKEIIKEFKNEIITSITESEIKVLGELQDMREETSTHQFSHMRINEEIIDLDNRVKKLEVAKN